MRTSEIAEQAQVHPNTVRLYEEWGFISPVPREGNGYRVYSELHLKQMRIARLAFRQEFIQNNLRKKATILVRLCGSEQFELCLREATAYLGYLQTEYEYALKAIETVEQIIHNKPLENTIYSHRCAAEIVQLSEETLRNWERNGLYSVARNTQNRRMYTERDIQQLLIIRTLRSAHFSITSIAFLFRKLQQGNEQLNEQPLSQENILQILQSPAFTHDFFHVTDDLINQLKIAMLDVKSIIAILQSLK